MNIQQKHLQQTLERIHKVKTYKSEFYTINSIFGNDWATFYCLLGGREAGKSYAAMNWRRTSQAEKRLQDEVLLVQTDRNCS